MAGAYDALTGPDDKGMVPVIAPVGQGQVNQLPPDVFAPLAAFGEAMGSAAEQGVSEAKGYAFDPMEKASTLEGVAEVTALLKKVAQDTKLQKVLVGEAPAEEPPKKEAAAEKPKKDDKMSPEDIDAMLK